MTLSEVVASEYGQLHRIASSWFRHERRDHTLQATAVLHEAFLHVSRSVRDQPGPRNYYLAAMARAMRQVLVAHARGRRAKKRGGGRRRVPGHPCEREAGAAIDVCELDDALRLLERVHGRSARGVELRYFGNLSNEQIGALLGVSVRTVQVDWQFARAWLTRALRSAS